MNEETARDIEVRREEREALFREVEVPGMLEVRLDGFKPWSLIVDGKTDKTLKGPVN